MKDKHAEIADVIAEYRRLLQGRAMREERSADDMFSNTHILVSAERLEVAEIQARRGNMYEALAMVYLSSDPDHAVQYLSLVDRLEMLAAIKVRDKIEDVANGNGKAALHAERAIAASSILTHRFLDDIAALKETRTHLIAAGKPLRRENFALAEMIYFRENSTVREPNPGHAKWEFEKRILSVYHGLVNS